MALIIKEGLLSAKWFPRIEILRHRRINVQKPRAPHYERAKYLEMLKPTFKEDDSAYLPPSVKCRKSQELVQYKLKVDNPLERIIAKEIFEKFESSSVIGFLHTNPIKGEDNFQARVFLKRAGYTLEVASRATMERALNGSKYEAVLALFVTHTAMVFSAEGKVKPLLKALRKIPQFILMGGIVEDRLLSLNQMKAYSEIADLTSARAHLVSLLSTVPQQLIGHLQAPTSLLVHQLSLISSTKQDS